MWYNSHVDDFHFLLARMCTKHEVLFPCLACKEEWEEHERRRDETAIENHFAHFHGTIRSKT
jgi:hypothetical protein